MVRPSRWLLGLLALHGVVVSVPCLFFPPVPPLPGVAGVLAVLGLSWVIHLGVERWSRSLGEPALKRLLIAVRVVHWAGVLVGGALTAVVLLYALRSVTPGAGLYPLRHVRLMFVLTILGPLPGLWLREALDRTPATHQVAPSTGLRKVVPFVVLSSVACMFAALAPPLLAVLVPVTCVAVGLATGWMAPTGPSGPERLGFAVRMVSSLVIAASWRLSLFAWAGMFNGLFAGGLVIGVGHEQALGHGRFQLGRYLSPHPSRLRRVAIESGDFSGGSDLDRHRGPGDDLNEAMLAFESGDLDRSAQRVAQHVAGNSRDLAGNARGLTLAVLSGRSGPDTWERAVALRVASRGPVGVASGAWAGTEGLDALAAASTGRSDEARRLLETPVEQWGRVWRAWIHLRRGGAFALLGDAEGAQREWRAGAGLGPGAAALWCASFADGSRVVHVSRA